MFSWVFLAPGWGKHSQASPQYPAGGHHTDIPWSSSLCCRYCSSSPRGRAAPCTPLRRGTAPSGTTTSAARWRLGERRHRRPGCGTGDAARGTRHGGAALGAGLPALLPSGGAGGAAPLSITAHVCSDPASLDPAVPPAPKAPGFLSLPRVKSLTTALSSLAARAQRGSLTYRRLLLQRQRDRSPLLDSLRLLSLMPLTWVTRESSRDFGKNDTHKLFGTTKAGPDNSSWHS